MIIPPKVILIWLLDYAPGYRLVTIYECCVHANYVHAVHGCRVLVCASECVRYQNDMSVRDVKIPHALSTTPPSAVFYILELFLFFPKQMDRWILIDCFSFSVKLTCLFFKCLPYEVMII